MAHRNTELDLIIVAADERNRNLCKLFNARPKNDPFYWVPSRYDDPDSKKLGYDKYSDWQLFLAELFFQTKPSHQHENFLKEEERFKYIPKKPIDRTPTRYQELNNLLPFTVLERIMYLAIL